MLVIKNDYDIGDLVYLRTDKDQLPRIIIAIKIYKAGEIVYELISGTIQSTHYPFEMSTEINPVLTSTN